MNWLFSITYYSPYVSGLTIYVKRLVEELAARHNQVTILCMQHDPDLKKIDVNNGVKIYRAGVLGRISKGFISADWIYQAVKEVRKTDIVVVNLPQAEGWIVATVAKILRKKIIAIYHCEVNLPNRAIQWLLEQANWLSLELADKIVTYTQDYANSSKLLIKYPDKLSCVYPPILNLKGDEMFEKQLQKKIGEGPLVGVAARLAREKGLEYLFEALEFMDRRIKIVVAGPMDPVGEKEYKTKILKLVEKYAGQVIFLGAIEPEKMGSFYKIIDVLVLPSVNSTEAFGMVQAEAMLKGVPVVASDLPGVRVPIARTGMGIIVPPKNPKALASAITEILRNRKKYVKKEKDLANEFDITETVNFYERLVK